MVAYFSRQSWKHRYHYTNHIPHTPSVPPSKACTTSPMKHPQPIIPYCPVTPPNERTKRDWCQQTQTDSTFATTAKLI
ncbi:hypothetical protein GQ44DRAFT_431138 [Phaeosphaeriaceae sp. PMI808]|nr:hypothetical protein GQ44DRAFT_431138 [Phaeosphaeriaceae sp. PMI808]